MERGRQRFERILRHSLARGRVPSAYLLAGPRARVREAARWLARALVCEGPAPERPCESCRACRLSSHGGEPVLDGSGRRGPLLRHVGDHPDLFWVERGAEDTRVRIGQIRELQRSLQLALPEPRRRAAVIADAEWLNQEAQNALLRLLEEPPPRTTLVLATTSPAALLGTVRSRCQRIALPAGAAEADPDEEELLARLAALRAAPLAEILDWAEAYRGARAEVAAEAERLARAAARWLHARVREAVAAGCSDIEPALEAYDRVRAARKALAQRNANPQMVAERVLLAVREASLA